MYATHIEKSPGVLETTEKNIAISVESRPPTNVYDVDDDPTTLT